jgi:hypothetical protein
MPTISQLPAASPVSAADEVPISQAGTARATSVGALLASMQPAIIVDSPSLIGRTSLGSGGPEQIDVGSGITISDGTLVANGLDHAIYPSTTTLVAESDLVISNHGSPMLMQASLLRGLFSAGSNVAIDPNGLISATGTTTSGGFGISGSSIGALQVISSLTSQDLVAVSHAGADHAIAYNNLLGGVTIDQAQAAGPAGDSDTIWTAQGSNIMTSQTFGAIWAWIIAKIPTYKFQTVELTTNTTLDATVHNGRMLICSQPITLIPLTNNMGNGFCCTVINASSSNIALGSGFVSSNGSYILAPWQSANLSCITYSNGTIAFAAMPGTATVSSAPGQVIGLSGSNTTSSTITASWQAPSSGGAVTSYIVQFRQTGSTFWTSSAPVINATTYQITALSPATSYDIVVEAQNSGGPGAASTVLTTATSSAALSAPSQVIGLASTVTSGTAVQLTWSAQTGPTGATNFTAQYRITGSSNWTSITGITGLTQAISGLLPATSYDFSVIGLNSAGAGPVSLTVTATTQNLSQSVSSITWNVAPSGTYTHGSGAIGVNAHVSPASSAVQFGFSLSATTPPSNWTVALAVNTDLWGAYVTTPSTPGTWYAWAVGLDGSAPTVSSSPFVVQ